MLFTINPNCRERNGDVCWPCILASSTDTPYFFAIRLSAPHAEIMRILAKVSLATAEDFASA